MRRFIRPTVRVSRTSAGHGSERRMASTPALELWNHASSPTATSRGGLGPMWMPPGTADSMGCLPTRSAKASLRLSDNPASTEIAAPETLDHQRFPSLNTQPPPLIRRSRPWFVCKATRLGRRPTVSRKFWLVAAKRDSARPRDPERLSGRRFHRRAADHDPRQPGFRDDPAADESQVSRAMPFGCAWMTGLVLM